MSRPKADKSKLSLTLSLPWRDFLTGNYRELEVRYTMTTEQILHAIGTSAGLSIVYALKCSAAARKERRQAAGYDKAAETRNSIPYRLGKLWARCQKRRS